MLADRLIDTVAYYYAFQSCGHVVMLLNPDLPNDMLESYINLYRPTHIWRPRATVSHEGKNGIIAETSRHQLSTLPNGVAPSNNELALLLTTSGSTGNPKVVRLSKMNIASNAEAFVEAISLDRNDRGAVNLPLFYTYGLAICHMHFFTGATLLLSEKKVYDPQFYSFLVREGVTNLHGVPYVYESLDRAHFFEKIPSSVRLMTMGGGKAQPSLHDKLNRLTLDQGIGFYAMYGQTEGTCILTKVPSDQKQNEPGCIGVPALGVKAYLDQESNELCFEGPGVCLGYATSWFDLSRGDDNLGVLRTGDIATIDERGRIYLTGRIRRFLKLKGVRINLDDIEAYLEMSMDVQVACTGSDERLICYAVLPAALESILAKVSERFNLSKRLIEVRGIGQLPRTPQGKIDYSLLSEN